MPNVFFFIFNFLLESIRILVYIYYFSLLILNNIPMFNKFVFNLFFNNIIITIFMFITFMTIYNGVFVLFDMWKNEKRTVSFAFQIFF